MASKSWYWWMVERYCFYSCKQQEGQSLPVYLAELWRLAATCDWTEEQLAINLQDKFVMELYNECPQDHRKPLHDLFHFTLMVKVTEKESFWQADDSSLVTHCSLYYNSEQIIEEDNIITDFKSQLVATTRGRNMMC